MILPTKEIGIPHAPMLLSAPIMQRIGQVVPCVSP
jgi:hypothetical protein